MTTPWIWLTAVLIILLALARVGVRAHGMLRILILAQVAYWGISFLLRPSILLIAQPSPKQNDSLADPRFAFAGYAEAIDRVGPAIAVGLFCFTVSIWIVTRSSSKEVNRGPAIPARAERDTLWVAVYVVGTLFRLLSTLGAGQNLILLLAGLGGVGAFLIVLFHSPRSLLPRLPILTAVAVGECWWSVSSTSKTPLLAMFLALAIRLASREMGRRPLVIGGLLLIPTLFVFSTIQDLKQTESTANDLLKVDETYPAAARPLLPFARRFDLISAVEDGRYGRAINWMPPERLARTVFGSIVPTALTGGESIGAGARWANEVSGPSLGVANRDVSLAEGFIGEGFAIAGYAGVAALSVMLAAATWGTARLLRSEKVFGYAIGAGVASSTLLFERGLFGGLEQSSRAVQLAAVVAILAQLLPDQSQKGRDTRVIEIAHSHRNS